MPKKRTAVSRVLVPVIGVGLAANPSLTSPSFDVGDLTALVTKLQPEIATMAAAQGPFSLTSVTIQLGVDASGTIGVITAGMSASIALTFER